MDHFWTIAITISSLVLVTLLLKTTLVLISPSPQPRRDYQFLNTKTNKLEKFPSLMASKPTLLLSVVVPAYNEEKRLESMLTEAIQHLQSLNIKFEIIIVDDGSRDSTFELASKIAKSNSNFIRVLKLVKNCGKGGAVMQGVMVSRGEYILFADADGATMFSEMDKLLTSCQSNPLSVAIGSRAHMVNTEAVVKVILMIK